MCVCRQAADAVCVVRAGGGEGEQSVALQLTSENHGTGVSWCRGLGGMACVQQGGWHGQALMRA
jgi:hypothetical protein